MPLKQIHRASICIGFISDRLYAWSDVEKRRENYEMGNGNRPCKMH